MDDLAAMLRVSVRILPIRADPSANKATTYTSYP
jgi:hypothetical protein